MTKYQIFISRSLVSESYRRMFVPSASVDNANFSTLPKYSLSMQLAHPCGIMRRVVYISLGLINDLRLRRGKRYPLVGPGASNAWKRLEAVDIVRVGLDASPGEYIAIKCLHHFDILGA